MPDIKKDSIEATKIVKMTESAAAMARRYSDMFVWEMRRPNFLGLNKDGDAFQLHVSLILSGIESEYRLVFSDLDRERCAKIYDKAHQIHKAKGLNGLKNFVAKAQDRFCDYSDNGSIGIFNQP